MTLRYKPDDFVLKVSDSDERTNSIANKYEAYLDAITTDKFEHVRLAIKNAVRFLVSKKYPTIKSLAEENWGSNLQLQLKFNSLEQYLLNFKILDRKTATIDLATGTGKSWVIYGISQIALSEGLVDKVLVLCPSLTIEAELKKKFEKLSGSNVNQRILRELNALYPAPSIKNANVPILPGDICIENIHAVYERTGSSIQDSFLGKGDRTLVISDEAHHVFSPSEGATKRWFEFITNPDYNFAYHIGLTGTPYVGNEYFYDVIYRYGINDAMEDRVVKKIDYKIEEADRDKGWDETWHNHLSFATKYSGKVKPITIIVTNRIVHVIQLWRELSEYISEKDNISFEDASKRVIWIASSVPSKKEERDLIETIVKDAEKVRKQNLLLLKDVDELDNPVEWIISVAMLTEGWDVKNVFQIVPHEQRAFNSKLLISQVLGRGLRVPDGLEQPVLVRINNHQKWSEEIKNLYEEVLELENRISYGYSPARAEYDFPLYNLDYIVEQKNVKSEKQLFLDEPRIEKLKPQTLMKSSFSEYSESGTINFELEVKDNESIDVAARQIKLFLKEKDEMVSKAWPLRRIESFLKETIESLGYDSSYISKDNLTTVKQAFGPMFRAEGKEVARLSVKANNTTEVFLNKLPIQTFSESNLKRHGHLYYSQESLKGLNREDLLILKDFLAEKEIIKSGGLANIKDVASNYGGKLEAVDFLQNNLIELPDERLKTPQSVVYVSFEPERLFMKALFENIDLFDSFFKSPDKGFYSLPYSYKPVEVGSSHVRRENFNPDFFLKLKKTKVILVVEVKADDDSRPRNRAKYRDGAEHFRILNEKLAAKDINWQYIFYFLSKENYTDFFQAVRNGRLNWKSELMQVLASDGSPF